MGLIPFRALLLILLLVVTSIALYHHFKPLPPGLAVVSPPRPATDVRFLFDATWVDSDGEHHKQQQIFDHMLELIAGARRLILLDAFLLNDFAGDAAQHRALGQELADTLAAQKAAFPDIQIVVITDPFNSLYGAVENRYLNQIRDSGIDVIETPLTSLRDSNPLWSALWRLCCQWFGNSGDGGWLPNPVGEEPVSLRTYLSLLNFKANHRKTLLTDTAQGWAGLVTSGNPHDASSAHDNSALVFNGPAVSDLYQSEMAVLAMAGFDTSALPVPEATADSIATEVPADIQVLTESGIRDTLIELLEQARAGDQIRMSMFYFSHRGVLEALIGAQQRGAAVQVLMDPSEDAFGRKKNGIPNRQVAGELVAAGVELRWCDTHGEQCHSKSVLIDRADLSTSLLLGSGNLTRRNLDNYNLETSVVLHTQAHHRAVIDARELFMRQWFNLEGQHFSAPYEKFRDDSRWRYLLYRLMEKTGLSTF